MFRRKPQPKPPPFAPYRQPQPPATVDHEPQLSPCQRQTYDWSEPDVPQLPAKRGPTYVPNASDIIQMPNVTMASPDANVTANVTPFATIEGKTLGSHSDRARGVDSLRHASVWGRGHRGDDHGVDARQGADPVLLEPAGLRPVVRLILHAAADGLLAAHSRRCGPGQQQTAVGIPPGRTAAPARH